MASSSSEWWAASSSNASHGLGSTGLGPTESEMKEELKELFGLTAHLKKDGGLGSTGLGPTDPELTKGGRLGSTGHPELTKGGRLGSTGQLNNDGGLGSTGLGSTGQLNNDGGLGSTGLTVWNSRALGRRALGLGPTHMPEMLYRLVKEYPYEQERTPGRSNQEHGYLRAREGEIVKVTAGQCQPGHSGNLYKAYVFAQPHVKDMDELKKRMGWVPINVLQPLDSWDSYFHDEPTDGVEFQGGISLDRSSSDRSSSDS